MSEGQEKFVLANSCLFSFLRKIQLIYYSRDSIEDSISSHLTASLNEDFRDERGRDRSECNEE